MTPQEIDELEKQLDANYAIQKDAIRRVRALVVDLSKGQVELPFGKGVAGPAESAERSPAISITQLVRDVARTKGGIFTADNVREAHPRLGKRQIVNAISLLRQKREISVLKPGKGRRRAVYQQAIGAPVPPTMDDF
ncbi:MAG: hypothetical protein P4L99_23890 [Chthoniobacter sp.]|nr:hypothetical protein [Chthoniobacter sp.]